jgi:DNA-binding NarL/FixJ family response regulator
MKATELRWVTTPVDLVLAAALTLASQVEIWAPAAMPGVADVSGSRPVLAATTLAITAPLAVRRAAPLAVLVVVLGASCVQAGLTTPTEGLSTLAAVLVAAYSGSAFSPVRRAVVGAVALAAAVVVLGHEEGDTAFMAIVFGSAWVMGYAVGRRSGQLERLVGEHRDLAERLAEASARLAEAERRHAAGTPPAPDDLAGLTARELEVARAVATGRSNAEIAEQLVISEWTVKTHVASILRKLGLRDRTQVVVVAYESGLVQPGQGADPD